MEEVSFSVEWLISDGGSENKPTVEKLWLDIIHIICAIHCLNNSFKDSMASFNLDTNSRGKPLCLTQIEQIMNWCRNQWSKLMKCARELELNLEEILPASLDPLFFVPGENCHI